MKSESFEFTDGLDRQATADEIRAAVELYSSCILEDVEETAMIIPFESGGYVRVTAEDFECANLVFELSRIIS